MAYQNFKRRMAFEIEARATSSATASATISLAQPTTVIPLTTTFTPVSSCYENRLTMLPPPNWPIFANEPVPAANVTFSDCYPPEFLVSYTSVSSGRLGSSIVPAMSPLVCPDNFCTMYQDDGNYAACCPSGYQFHPPDTTIDASRPAYGGLCYSDFTGGQDYPVTAYNETGDTASQVFPAASTDQAFAHPIDGWALSAPSAIGCRASSSSTLASSSASSDISAEVSSAPATSATADASSESSSISSGAIAGAVVGGVAGLAAIVAFIWFILAYYRKNKRPPPPPPKVHQVADDFACPKDTIYYRHEAAGDYGGNEIGSSGRLVPEKDGRGVLGPNGGNGAYEMDAHTPVELDAGAVAQYPNDKKPGMAI